MIPLLVDGITYDPQRVIDALSPQVLPERLEKLRSVIGRRTDSLIPVLENIYDRGNTSAVMRSAEAFGFYHFHHIIGIDRFKEAKRVTQGADKWLVQKQWRDTESCISQLKADGYKIYVTHLEGGKPIYDVPFDQPVALCFGNEKEGASPTLTALADERVYIPMQGFVQSFNISVAAALCFQHIHSIHRLNPPPPISDDERQHLLALYLYRSCRKPDLKSLLGE